MSEKKSPMIDVSTVTSGAFRDSIFNNHKVQELTSRKRHLVTIRVTDSAQDALAVMGEHRILSVPVVDPMIDENQDEHFIGIVNLIDIVTAVVFQPIFSTYNTDTDIDHLTDDVFAAAQKLSVFQMTVDNLLGLSSESNKLWVINAEEPLSRLVEVFSAGVHRVLVRNVDEDGHNRYGLYSQTDLVRFINDHSKEPVIAKVLSGTLASLGLVPGENSKEAKKYQLITSSPNSTALTGFRKMTLQSEISALPVVDKNVCILLFFVSLFLCFFVSLFHGFEVGLCVELGGDRLLSYPP